METLCGKHSAALDAATLAARLTGYENIAIDLGTGDGRYARRLARACPTHFVIGVDTCRENLREVSRDAPTNALFLIANALALPSALDGQATAVTINFPWGSLLQGLLDEQSSLPPGVRAITRSGAALTVRLNAGALAEVGWPLAHGGERVRQTLAAHGFAVGPAVAMDAMALRACPTSWARRLAVGRDPRAIWLSAMRRQSCD